MGAWNPSRLFRASRQRSQLQEPSVPSEPLNLLPSSSTLCVIMTRSRHRIWYVCHNYAVLIILFFLNLVVSPLGSQKASEGWRPNIEKLFQMT